MPQRSLTTNKPWIYVAADEMSQYDLLAAQQLNQMAGDHLPDLNEFNELALQGTAKPASTVVSPTKRKRSDHAPPDDSLLKRVKLGDARPAAKKLGIPKKAQQNRHMVNTHPAVKGDIFEFDSPEKPRSNPAANTKLQRSKKVLLSSGMPDKNPAVHKSSPRSKAPQATKRSTRANAALEGPGSAFLNGRVDLTEQSGSHAERQRKQASGSEEAPKSSPRRKVGRPKKRTIGYGQGVIRSPEETAGRRTKATVRAEKGSITSFKATSVHSERQEGLQGSGHAVAKARKASKVPVNQPVQNVAGEEEEEEEEDDDVDGFASEPGDENVAEDSMASQDEIEEVVEESERQDSDYQGSQIIDDDDKVVEEHMELLGQHEEWEKVLRAAESVHRTDLATETIKELYTDIKKGRSLYRQIHACEETDPVFEELNEQLQDRLKSIEVQIKNLSEHKLHTKKSETITDIYSRAIPAMVYLLKRALNLRTSQSLGLHGFHALSEIVNIQDMLVRLCEKARGWKVKPNTPYPIIKPTTSVIFPYIRDMKNKFFSPKLNQLRVREKMKQNALKTVQAEKEASERLQREGEASTQRSSQRDLSIRDHIEEELQNFHSSKRLGRPVVPATAVGRVEKKDDIDVNDRLVRRNPGSHEWTDGETQELVVQLSRSENLPCKQP